jgi:hypothetical protein
MWCSRHRRQLLESFRSVFLEIIFDVLQSSLAPLLIDRGGGDARHIAARRENMRQIDSDDVVEGLLDRAIDGARHEGGAVGNGDAVESDG